MEKIYFLFNVRIIYLYQKAIQVYLIVCKTIFIKATCFEFSLSKYALCFFLYNLLQYFFCFSYIFKELGILFLKYNYSEYDLLIMVFFRVFVTYRPWFACSNFFLKCACHSKFYNYYVKILIKTFFMKLSVISMYHFLRLRFCKSCFKYS